MVQVQRAPPFPPGQSEPREGHRAGDVDELRSMFIQNVSHEFRTPLGIIQGYAELLYGEDLGTLEPEQKRALSVVVNRVHELRKMVERISILMAIEMHSAASVPFDLADVVTRVVGERRADADQAGIELVAYLEPGLPLMSGDPYQLEHVVESLVENALKFTLAGGRVEVDVYAEPGWICLAVTDTGIGIPEEELGRIFSDFYQADGSTTRKYGGIGLGLTLVKAVVEDHAGRIEVESQPEQGSQFLIRLPVLQPDGQVDQPIKQVSAVPNILVVDEGEYTILPLQRAMEVA